MSSWSIGAASANGMGSSQTIFFSIVRLFVPYGISWVIPNQEVDLFACWWKGGRSRVLLMEDGAFLPYVVPMEGTK